MAVDHETADEDASLIRLNEELPLEAMAARMGVSPDEVLRMEAAGQLFSFVRPQRSSCRRYPVYQLAPEIQVLIPKVAALLERDGATLHTYFTAREPNIANLSVRELIYGQATGSFSPDDWAADILQQPQAARIESALKVAEFLRDIYRNEWG